MNMDNDTTWPAGGKGESQYPDSPGTPFDSWPKESQNTDSSYPNADRKGDGSYPDSGPQNTDSSYPNHQVSG